LFQATATYGTPEAPPTPTYRAVLKQPDKQKASSALAAARTLLEAGDADFAAGRGYYAMFYAVQALLNEKGLRFRKHGGVHAAFGQHFAATGLMDAKYHRWLLDAFDKRIQGDYGIDAVVTREDVQRIIEQATEFVSQARHFLGDT
jgi:uncharacterized protein (UPF0332 family)